MFDPQTSGGLIIGICSEQSVEAHGQPCGENIQPVATIGQVIGADSAGHIEIEEQVSLKKSVGIADR
jgi:hypothetical protein